MTAVLAPAAVDFTRSIPPALPGLAARLSQTLRALADDPDVAVAFHDSAAGGSPRDRAAGARWLSNRFASPVAVDRLVTTNGTQSALMLCLAHLARRGGRLLAESLTYTPLATVAARAGVAVAGLALDGEGICPGAFAAACAAAPVAALYCNPTVHNPTTATMSVQRRLDLAAIARRHGVAIIEDDPLGCLHADAPPPIAALAPDIGWYLSGLTKCLSHGFRIAYLVAPSAAAAAAFLQPIRTLSHWFPAPLSAAVATRWIEDGSAHQVADQIGAELRARQQQVIRALGSLDLVSPPGAMHAWLRLGSGVDCIEAARRLAAAGVLVRSADRFAVDGRSWPAALRLSLSCPPDRAAVRIGAERIAALLG